MIRTEILRCPQCRTRLSGLPVDRLFFCPNCGVAVDFWETPVDVIPVRFYSPGNASDQEMIHLPVWKYGLEVSVTQDNALLETATGFIPDVLWLFGCIFQKQSAYGDPNTALTQMKPAFDYSDRPQAVIGCQLRRKHADKLVVPVTTAIIDEWKDVTELEISIVVKSRMLVALPFLQENKYLRLAGTDFGFNQSLLSFHPWLDKLKSGTYIP